MFGCIFGLSSPFNAGRYVGGWKGGREGAGSYWKSFSSVGFLSLLFLAVFVFQGCGGKKKEESDLKKGVGGAERVAQDEKVGGSEEGEEGKDRGESETGEKEEKGEGVDGAEGGEGGSEAEGDDKDEGGEGGGVLAGLKAQKKEISLDEPWKTKNFDLVLSGPKELVKGKVSKLMLTLTARKPYKANKLFPFELKIETISKGLEVKKKSFKKKDATVFSDGKVVYEIEVKGVEEGEQQVLKGKYKFSVCTVRFCETPEAGINVELVTKK